LQLADVALRLEFLDSLYDLAKADNRVLSVDKSWDAMHRALCGGWLDAEHGEQAKRACVIGGRQLSDCSNWIISYVDPALAKQVVEAITGISHDWFRLQYFSLDRIPHGFWVHRYKVALTEQDFDYTWEYFSAVRDFYHMAISRGLATVFVVDQ
jgi:hypothetical protein